MYTVILLRGIYLPVYKMNIRLPSRALIIYCFSLFNLIVCTDNSESDKTFEDYYDEGVEDYNDENWKGCYTNIKTAIKLHKQDRLKRANCRIKCGYDTDSHGFNTADVDNLILDYLLWKAKCMQECIDTENVVTQLEQEINDAFDALLPYDYLQICSYKTGDLRTAVSAAYTYLLAHPSHDVMRSNIAYYRGLDAVEDSYFHDLQRKQFQRPKYEVQKIEITCKTEGWNDNISGSSCIQSPNVETTYDELYDRGVIEYSNENWKDAISLFEFALEEYYTEHKRCEALCESHVTLSAVNANYDQIIDDYRRLLQCKSKCEKTLSTMYGTPRENYLREHYNYLQYAYYKADNLASSCQAVASFLLLEPDNEVMNHNRLFYQQLPGVKDDFFVPRKDVVLYKQNRKMQQMLLEKHKQRKQSSHDSFSVHVHFYHKNAAYETLLRRTYYDRGVNLYKENQELGGKHRVAVDNLQKPGNCEKLVQLANTAGIQGDGYDGTGTSPHTKHEKFQGITPTAAAQLAREGKVDASLVQLYLDVSSEMRSFFQAWLHMNTTLYPHFTHLVCRTALTDQQNRKDFSHPIHSDNCFIQADGTCPKEKPAYTERDFTALLYLNDGFKGGDFFFAHANKTIQSHVSPHTGRLIAFPSGDYHGVEALTEGRRCALAVWYTLDAASQDNSYQTAQSILDALPNAHSSSIGVQPHVQTLEQNESISVTMDEVDLNGPTRFCADKVMTPMQCEQLMTLAHNGAVEGDGYDRPSPHTKREQFTGLTMRAAVELVEKGHLQRTDVELFLDVTEKVRRITQAYFQLEQHLYFSFTHLVCRTALEGYHGSRTDLSHPIHSDNCIIKNDKTCVKEPPAYTERDYSALLYLNDNFTGGDFFFSHQNFSTQSTVRPHCGRMVAFDSGNYHGVQAILSGQRCAVALWFTLNKVKQETSQQTARGRLEKLKTPSQTQAPPTDEMKASKDENLKLRGDMGNIRLEL